ncbi:MAG: glutathione S-transferase family protein, partial [Pseudomonadota bacterium]
APVTRAERTAWLLNELGLEYELERYKLGDKSMMSPEFIAISPNGRVPVLQDGELRITESTAIAQYLLARYSEGRLVPDIDSAAYPAYLQWMHYAEGMIMPPINNYVVETILLPPDRASEVHAKRAIKLLNNVLKPLDAHLADREYLAGEFSGADTITGHASMIAAELGADLSDKPNLAAYIERLKVRPALQKVLALRAE